MEQKTLLAPLQQPPGLAIDWAESDWFRVWLRLARHEDQDKAADHPQAPSWDAHAAAA